MKLHIYFILSIICLPYSSQGTWTVTLPGVSEEECEELVFQAVFQKPSLYAQLLQKASLTSSVTVNDIERTIATTTRYQPYHKPPSYLHRLSRRNYFLKNPLAVSGWWWRDSSSATRSKRENNVINPPQYTIQAWLSVPLESVSFSDIANPVVVIAKVSICIRLHKHQILGSVGFQASLQSIVIMISIQSTVIMIMCLLILYNKYLQVS